MGSVATQQAQGVPSVDRVEPGSFPLHLAGLPESPNTPTNDAHEIAEAWVKTFNYSILSGETEDLFLNESYWRDHLCLSWDFHCLQGSKKISAFSRGKQIRLDLDTSSKLRSPNVTLLEEGVVTVQAFLTIETDVGKGDGVLRIVQDNSGSWKCFTLYTYLKELKGHEERIGTRRPLGVNHGEHHSQKNWLDRRKDEEELENKEEPAVLILGAGQAGLTTAARLKMLGVSSLIVDREERVGDNWRTRYHQLVLHDPVWFDHLPYMSFPASWPVFTPKDKLGDWFEAYVKLLELNVWTQTTITESSWDDASGKWTVVLERTRNGEVETRVLHPKHLVQATGASGEPNFPSSMPGLSSFNGNLCHSSKFPGAVPAHGKGKKAIVVGCCNSGHDIAQDLHENGYAVTIVQRSTTFVVTADTSRKDMAALYGEVGSPSTEDADTIFHSLPNPVLKRLKVNSTAAMGKEDETLLRGLEAAGFHLDKGPDDSGLWIKYLQRGGGYYIDVGCSQLIVDKKISVKSGHEIKQILPQGLEFDDGEVLEADEIVFATGYLNMRTQCRRVFGDAVADRVNDAWGFDEEGELRGVWRSSGHPGFWLAGGNLALCRFFSRLLALQIKGLEEGLFKHEDL